MQHSSSFLLGEIKLYKDKITVRSTELEYFLKYLDEKVNKKTFLFCSPGKASVAPSFARAFQTLTQKQQQDYYLACLKIVYDFNQQKEIIQPSETSEKVEIQYRLENKQWKKTTAVINSKETTIEIEFIGAKINLEHYLMRSSKTSDRFAFVLQSTKADCIPQSIRLGFSKKQDYEQFITKMNAVLMNGLKNKISKLMGLTRESIEYSWLQQRQGLSIELSHKSVVQAHKSLRTMLKSKKAIQIDASTQLFKQPLSKETISSQMFKIIQGLSSFDQYQLIEEGLFVHHTYKRVRKVCLFEAESIARQLLINQFTKHQNFKLWKKALSSVSLIGQIQSENIRFYHQIDVYEDRQEVDYVYLRCRIERDGCTYFIDKSIATSEYGSHETSDSRGKIQYCLWRITQANELIEIQVQAEINHVPCKDICQAMSEYIGQLQNIPLCLQSGIPLRSKKLGKPCVSFFSMQPQSFLMSPKQVDSSKIKFLDEPCQESSFYSIDLNNQNQLQSIKESQIYSRGQGSSQFSQQDEVLKQIYRYQVQPEGIQKHQYKEIKNGKFFDQEECVTNQLGDLVFTNQDKIRAQGGVIKSVLKKIGANLFSGKNVLNVSFPIEIFAPDTNIQRLCKGMAYAPHFLENKTKSSPLQRMKAAICFALGNLLLYIDMAKPFNPILGQTYQGFIDGCPIYGEQTSHHPPISSLFLVGRGYFVSGNIQATVDLGMNSVSGTNAGEYRISFNSSDPSKNVVIFTSPPGELSGVIYGERKLNITDKSRFFDPENQLFCELHWGKKKSKNPVSRYHDYLEGTIVELNKPASSLAKAKPSDKDTVLGYITGRWTETIFFDGETLFEVNKLQPFKVIDQKMPLQSDSRMRMDRVLVQRGKISEAQIEKQKLQELQRKDRKLRQKYQK